MLRAFSTSSKPNYVVYLYLAFTGPYFLPFTVMKNSRVDCIEMLTSEKMEKYFLPFEQVRSSNYDAGTLAKSTVSVATRKTEYC
jgi:hypothetical protein